MAKIEIIADRCKGCGYCIRYCPKKVLEMGRKVNKRGYEYAEAARPDDCIGCAVCGRMCPEGAIDVYR